ncbi:MAG: DUF3467 domain-containing protein [Planctomycetaceae bacterium]
MPEDAFDDSQTPQQSSDGGTNPPGLQRIEHSMASARVPEEVGRGVFATDAIVLGGAEEIWIDFVLGLGHPPRLAARVILPPGVAKRLVAALDESLGKYAQRFGGLPRDPANAQKTTGQVPQTPQSPQPPQAPPQPAPRPIAEVYETIKASDETLSGVYANLASITFSGSEFCIDFVAGLFPRSIVAARVYMAAPHIPELLASLKRSVGS